MNQERRNTKTAVNQNSVFAILDLYGLADDDDYADQVDQIIEQKTKDDNVLNNSFGEY